MVLESPVDMALCQNMLNASGRLVAQPSAAEANSGPGLAALGVLVREISGNDKRWLRSTKELRLVSLQLCNACRRTLYFRVWVERGTPCSLWTTTEIAEADPRSSRGVGRGIWPRLRRFPRLSGVRAAEVVWDLPVGDLSAARNFLEGAVRLQFGFRFDDPLQGCSPLLPDTLLVLDLGPRFQHDVLGVSWPAKLRELNFGASFNGSILGIALPSGLRRLTFGASFNKPVAGVAWPASLLILEFGQKFDQPVAIEGVSWPERLESLSFGRDFSHDLGVVSETNTGESTIGTTVVTGPACRGQLWWPASLRRLVLSEGFWQPIDTVVWPLALEELHLDCVSVRRDTGVVTLGAASTTRSSIVWPSGLKRLTLDFTFHQPVEDVPLPPALEELTFGNKFNQSIGGVLWPQGLKQISFGASFNQNIDGVIFPPRVERLTFGYCFDQSLERVWWPPALQRLVFRDHFDQSIDDVAWPASLKVLQFGCRFNQPLSGGPSSSWPPPRLQRLILGKKFDQPAEHVVLPPTLVFLEFGEGCRQRLRKIEWPRGLREIVVRKERTILSHQGLDGLPKGCKIR